MKKHLINGLAVMGVILLLLSLIVSSRVSKDIHKKLEFENTYAIQNVSSGTCLRPLDAGYKNENQIIGYDHQNWECITWEMIALGDNTYLLKNLFTEKTFQPQSGPKAGVALWQQPLGGTPLQYWEFLKQPDGTALIRLKDTDLYVTISSKDVNAAVILMPLNNGDEQKWQLIGQTPWI